MNGFVFLGAFAPWRESVLILGLKGNISQSRKDAKENQKMM